MKPIEFVQRGDCMICTSHVPDIYGYPRLMRGGKYFLIPRLVMLRRHGKQYEGAVTRHTCDEKLCINPDHLIPGTRAENQEDMRARGRAAKGEKNARAKISESDVFSIRKMAANRKITQTEIGQRFGISQEQVCNINRRRAWAHVP